MIQNSIRAERRAQGVTLEELARRTGIAASNLSRLERPVSNPRLSTVERVLRGLGLTLSVEPATTQTVADIEARMAEGAARLARIDVVARNVAARLAWKEQRGVVTDVEARLVEGG